MRKAARRESRKAEERSAPGKQERHEERNAPGKRKGMRKAVHRAGEGHKEER